MAPRHAVTVLAARAVVLLLASVVLLGFLPLLPGAAAGGLDPSWSQALHVAVERGMDFGTDIVFTYGPLGFVHPRMYWPGLLFAITVAFWALLAAGMLDAMASLTRGRPAAALPAWLLLAVATPFAAIYAHDVFVLAYLLAWVWQVEADDPGPVRLGAHGALVGLVALSKLTFAFAASLAIVGCVAILAWRGARRRAAWPVGSSAATFLAGWILLSQPLEGLFPYLWNGYDIVSGYGEAMSMRGPIWEMRAFGFAAIALVVIAAWRSGPWRDGPRLATAIVFAALAALAWKQAFTRHDAHALIGFIFIAFAGAIVAARFAGRRPWASLAAFVIGASLLGCVLRAVEARDPGTATPMVAEVLRRPVASLAGLVDLAQGAPRLHARHDAVQAELRRDAALPQMTGTVDVYSYDQAVAFASGLRWNPRPIFQSYSAYTKKLVEMNRAHLERADAPDSVLMRIQPIDGRLAAFEDGASWLPLLERYALVDEGHFLVLRREPRPAPAKVRALPPWRGQGWRELPDEGVLRTAAITVEAPPRKWNEYFRGPRNFDIELRVAGEAVPRRFRLLRDAARVPFLISPLVEQNTDLGSLFVPCDGGAPPRRVDALRVLDGAGQEVPYTLEVGVVEALPRFETSRRARRGMACDLVLTEASDAVRAQPYVTEAGGGGLHAHPPAAFRFARPIREARVCAQLAGEAVRRGGSDGYVLRIERAGAVAAERRVEAARAGEEACVEARFDRPVSDAILRVEAGGHAQWDWVFISGVTLVE